MLEEYRKALTKLIDNSKEIDELTLEMTELGAAINQLSAVMKSDLLADQKRLEAKSHATIGETEQLILILAAGGFVLGCIWAFLLGIGISRPIAGCVARCASRGRQFRRRAARPGRKDELGEMAGAVEELKLRPSPRPNATPPRRSPRTRLRAPRVVPNSFVLPMISSRRSAPSSPMFRPPPCSSKPPRER